MNRINILQTLLVMAMLGSCSRDEAIEMDVIASDTPISFSAEELTADWSTKASTRGVPVDDFDSQVSSIMVYAFLNTTSDYVTSCYIDNQAATVVSDTGAAETMWGFSPAKYYLVNNTLDFLAYTPEANASSLSDNNGITQTLNFASKSVKFNYSVPTTGRNQPDLMLATPQTKIDEDNHLDEMEFNHVLTQITMSAKVNDEADANRYKITRFAMHDITIAGELTYSVDSGIGSWNGKTDGDFVTSAMLPNEEIVAYYDETTLQNVYETPWLLTTDMESIMTNGQALLMIPQAIEGKSGTAPTIQITITDTQESEYTYTYFDEAENKDVEVTESVYLTYRTDKLTLPSPETAGWKMGQHIDLQFEFEVDENQEVIPLSFTAKLLDWVDTPVDKYIDASIYAYLGESSFSASGGIITLYTNGEVTGVSGAATGFTNNSDNSYTLTITAAGTLTVKIKNSDDSTITKNFTITD